MVNLIRKKKVDLVPVIVVIWPVSVPSHLGIDERSFAEAKADND
jgi:hypothetical protein